MLPAAARMRRRRDFVLTVRRGRRTGGRLLTAYLGPLPVPPATPRVGLVVDRRVGSAVARNLVARRLRHLVRPRLGQVPPGAGLVIRAHPSAAQAAPAELERELAAALDRLTTGAPR